jgi:hypothetical protein
MSTCARRSLRARRPSRWPTKKPPADGPGAFDERWLQGPASALICYWSDRPVACLTEPTSNPAIYSQEISERGIGLTSSWRAQNSGFGVMFSPLSSQASAWLARDRRTRSHVCARIAAADGVTPRRRLKLLFQEAMTALQAMGVAGVDLTSFQHCQPKAGLLVASTLFCLCDEPKARPAGAAIIRLANEGAAVAT